MVMKRVEVALSYFEDGFSCSQSVLTAFSPSLGLGEEVSLKISQAFGGGMSRSGGVCGAVTGALMVIGLKFGRTSTDDTESKERTYLKAQEFVRLFKGKHGSINCSELIGYNLGTEEGLIAARESGVIKDRCPGFVASAVEIVESLLGSY